MQGAKQAFSEELHGIIEERLYVPIKLSVGARTIMEYTAYPSCHKS